MAVTLTGTAGLFTRLGKFVKAVNTCVSGFGQTLQDSVEAVTDQFADTEQSAVDGVHTAKESYRGVHTTYLNALASYGSAATIAQVDRDAPLNTQTVYAALAQVDAQMRSAVDSIQRPTTAVTVTANSANLSDTVVTASLTNTRGEPLDLVLAETISLAVTADSANGGTAWQETVGITGQAAVPVTSWRWPLGSGANTSLRVCDPETTGYIRDGGFETWAGTGNNTPTYWTISTGTAGTHVFRESTEVLRSSYGAKLTSDGSVLVTLRQAVTLAPSTVYGCTVFVKASASDGSGIFRVRLVNGSGTVINNDAGTALSTTADMSSTISTSAFSTVSQFFQTPRQLPDTVYLEFGYSVSPSSGKSLYVDGVGLGLATAAYTGGPYLFACSRASKSAQSDKWSAVVTNSAGNNSFVRGLDRLFNLRGNGLYIVSASSPTITDTLTN